VRPDQFVAWAGGDAPDDVVALLRKVTGTAEGGGRAAHPGVR
jgi:hypothetical protein